MKNTKRTKQPWYKIWWVWAIVVGVMLIGLIVNGGNKQPAHTTPAPTISVILEKSEPTSTNAVSLKPSEPSPTKAVSLKPSELSPTATATQTIEPTTESDASESPDLSTEVSGELTVHFIDVGQADSIFIELPNAQSILIDAGNNADGDDIVRYIKKKGYDRIDYVVGTHPHEDHIGGMDNVVESFDIGTIYMPKASSNTRTFEDLLNAISNKGLSVTTAKAGVSILDTSNLQISILAPNSTGYDDINDYSAVVKLVYGNASFLFMGDAEEISEREIKSDVDVDVLKVGHHGSSSSTSSSFLKKVTPQYAVISVGKDNSYAHPAKATLDKLKSAGAKIYRTDLNGTVIISTDGNSYKIDTQKAASEPVTQTTPAATSGKNNNDSSSTVKPSPTSTKDNNSSGGKIVYITETGEKYHKSGCQYLKKSKIEITLEEAKAYGYTPCSRCRPPK
jgi:competence protein ComEC